MDCRASRSQRSARLLIPEFVGGSIQCRQLSEAILETIGRDSRSSGCDPPGLSAHLFHAHAESRHRQGHAAPPPAYRSPNHSKALREGNPHELACGCCCSGRTNNRYSGRSQNDCVGNHSIPLLSHQGRRLFWPVQGHQQFGNEYAKSSAGACEILLISDRPAGAWGTSAAPRAADTFVRSSGVGHLTEFCLCP